uniref:Putative secreted protein n=1 Tax=Amblyomma parvum TaxID=251391 RepID=A0A023G2K9_AMBPA
MAAIFAVCDVATVLARRLLCPAHDCCATHSLFLRALISISFKLSDIPQTLCGDDWLCSVRIEYQSSCNFGSGLRQLFRQWSLVEKQSHALILTPDVCPPHPFLISASLF